MRTAARSNQVECAACGMVRVRFDKQGRRCAPPCSHCRADAGSTRRRHPESRRCGVREGRLHRGPGTTVQVPRGDRDADTAAHYLVELWTRTNGLSLPVTTGPTAHAITFQRRSGFAPEGYGLDVTPQRITVSASTAAGLFYGAVTLWQLLPPATETGRIPAQTIRDAPVYPWRGVMLDSAATFSHRPSCTP